MIAVIADDFTGAAELAGISLRYGLSVIVYLDNGIDGNADVAIICTDSRSMHKSAALYCTADAVKAIIKHKPSFFYKKIDSVLRGFIIDEVKVQMELSEKIRAFIFPANPTLKRTINNGEYFIGEKKITETAFLNDPEFPIRSSKITAMVNDESVKVLKHYDLLPVEGIVIGEAKTVDDTTKWTTTIDESWMLAGGGDFYAALLEKKYQARPQKNNQIQLPHLYVCGTAFKDRTGSIKKTDCVVYLPEIIDEPWLAQICNIIKEKRKAILAIEESTQSAFQLRVSMAKAVKEIVIRANVKEIFIEGGSTAAAVLHELNIMKLSPVSELQRGVVRMKAGNLFVTVKPGSYQLPEELIKLYSIY